MLPTKLQTRRQSSRFEKKTVTFHGHAGDAPYMKIPDNMCDTVLNRYTEPNT